MILSDFVNDEEPENKNAKIGQAIASVYCIGCLLYTSQIRRMCKAINKPVLALHRAAIGKISVKNLKIGQYRPLTNKEIEELIK